MSQPTATPSRKGAALPALADPINAGIFCSEEQAGLAMLTLLNDVLNDSGDVRIGKILRLIPQKLEPSGQERSYRIDVYAETEENEYVIFEVSLDKYQVVNDRSFIYCQQAIALKLPKGADWFEMPRVMPKRVIMLNILDFEERKGADREETDKLDFHQVVEMTYRQEPRTLASKRFFAHNIELPKFRRITPDFGNNLHCWLFMLCQGQDKGVTLNEVVESEPRLAEFAKREGVRQYMTQYAVVTANPKTQLEYYLWAQNSMLEQENLRLAKEEAMLAGRLAGERAGRLAGERAGRLAGERDGRLAGERDGRLAGEQKGRDEGLEIGRNEGLEMGERKALEFMAMNAIQKLGITDPASLSLLGGVSIDRARELIRQYAPN